MASYQFEVSYSVPGMSASYSGKRDCWINASDYDEALENISEKARREIARSACWDVSSVNIKSVYCVYSCQ